MIVRINRYTQFDKQYTSYSLLSVLEMRWPLYPPVYVTLNTILHLVFPPSLRIIVQSDLAVVNRIGCSIDVLRRSWLHYGIIECVRFQKALDLEFLCCKCFDFMKPTLFLLRVCSPFCWETLCDLCRSCGKNVSVRFQFWERHGWETCNMELLLLEWQYVVQWVSGNSFL